MLTKPDYLSQNQWDTYGDSTKRDILKLPSPLKGNNGLPKEVAIDFTTDSYKEINSLNSIISTLLAIKSRRKTSNNEIIDRLIYRYEAILDGLLGKLV